MLFSQITNPSHNTQIVPFLASRFFERAAYFGIMSFLFFRILHIDIMSHEDLLKYFDVFKTYLFVGILLGAIVGDLFIGNKKAMLIGSVLMVVSIFLLSQPTVDGLFYGLFLLAIGNGLYAPNLLAGFARQYNHNHKMFDAGFILMMLTINFGGVVGPLLIIPSDRENFSPGFWIAGTLMLLAVIFAFFTKQAQNDKQNHKPFTYNLPKIFLFAITTGLFWYILNGYISSTQILKSEIYKNSYQMFNIEKFESGQTHH